MRARDFVVSFTINETSQTAEIVVWAEDEFEAYIEAISYLKKLAQGQFDGYVYNDEESEIKLYVSDDVTGEEYVQTYHFDYAKEKLQ